MSGRARRDDVRARLAQATRRTHLRLHRDPVLGRLVAADISRPQYLRALQRFSAAYGTVEAARRERAAWPELSLANPLSALSRDLGPLMIAPPALPVADETELLGGLYVAHGAAFGRSVFRGNVMLRLPAAPTGFIGLAPDAQNWRFLLSLIEERGQSGEGFAALVRGAEAAFAAAAGERPWEPRAAKLLSSEGVRVERRGASARSVVQVSDPRS